VSTKVMSGNGRAQRTRDTFRCMHMHCHIRVATTWEKRTHQARLCTKSVSTHIKAPRQRVTSLLVRLQFGDGAR